MKKLKKLEIENIIQLKKDENFNYISDVLINKVDEIKKICRSFECHIFLYPYHRETFSSDVHFRPYEEYVKDISKDQRSIYKKIIHSGNKFFGIFLGVIITAVFAFFYPQGLLSIEAIVSIFGAYTIGKEIWIDFENLFTNITKRSRLQLIENYYSYKLDKYNTLTKYSNLAKKYRYDKSSLVPQKMEFIELSNSQTVRMFFDTNDLKDFYDNTARILSIHFNPEKLDLFENNGYMLGVKLCFNRQFLFLRKSVEFFQSFNNKTLGCLDEREKWYENSLFFRKTFQISNLKYFWKKGITENSNMIKF